MHSTASLDALERLLHRRSLAEAAGLDPGDLSTRIDEAIRALELPPSLTPGAHVGDLRVEALEARESSLETWRARGPDGRPALLLRFRPDRLGDGEALSRFRRAAQAWVESSLAPGRPPSFARAEVIDTHGLCLAVELPSDLPRADPTRLSLRARLALFESVARALAWAHGRGRCHLDLRPPRVWVDAHGRALVLGFGLTDPRHDALLAFAEKREAHMTHAAPEQLLAGRPVDARADLWALGRLLEGLLLRERRGFPDPTMKGLARPWADLIRRACDPDPDRRPANVEVLLHGFTRARRLLALRSPIVLGALLAILGLVALLWAMGLRS